MFQTRARYKKREGKKKRRCTITRTLLREDWSDRPVVPEFRFSRIEVLVSIYPIYRHFPDIT